jgi:hypothetical protein
MTQSDLMSSGFLIKFGPTEPISIYNLASIGLYVSIKVK